MRYPIDQYFFAHLLISSIAGLSCSVFAGEVDQNTRAQIINYAQKIQNNLATLEASARVKTQNFQQTRELKGKFYRVNAILFPTFTSTFGKYYLQTPKRGINLYDPFQQRICLRLLKYGLPTLCMLGMLRCLWILKKTNTQLEHMQNDIQSFANELQSSRNKLAFQLKACQAHTEQREQQMENRIITLITEQLTPIARHAHELNEVLAQVVRSRAPVVAPQPPSAPHLHSPPPARAPASMRSEDEAAAFSAIDTSLAALNIFTQHRAAQAQEPGKPE